VLLFIFILLQEPFTLDEATRGLQPAKGQLHATIVTGFGDLECDLFGDKAPQTVANFVGLARGKRPWRDPRTGQWQTGKPFYDGLTFHRIIPGFIIQGGDVRGDGTGDPGYMLASEADNGLIFDRPGLLAMATRGSDTNGSQFFVTEMARISHLDHRATIFGICEPQKVVQKLSRATRDDRNRPLAPLYIKKVKITRRSVSGAR
jgi:peptidyl-prolyl cis-trans isomerase A (cyclophilin A)